jgi:DNA-binding NarL/FixJ family response regulator
MIRVLLVDDQELVRTGLRGILRPEFGFDIVGECADGCEVATAVDSLAPDGGTGFAEPDILLSKCLDVRLLV